MYRSAARAALAVAALLMAAPAVYAQTAAEIVARNLEAKGGADKLRETNSVRLGGTVTMQGMQGKTVTLSKRPNLMRRELEISGQKIVQGFDGTTIWMVMRDMPAQEMPPGPQTDYLKRSIEFDSAFLDWQKKGHKIEYKGKVTEGGKELHHLVLTQKDAPATHYYIDAATGLETKTTMDVNDPQMKGQMETRFSDYRTVDGRVIPFVMTQLMNGTQVMQVRLDKVEFNVPIDDALFRMPK